MRTVALISGGKDSCYNMVQCVSEGHDLVALANLKPVDRDELDSYMYQTVGHQAIDLYAEAMTLPLYRSTIKGTSKSIGQVYQPTRDDEVEDLYSLLKEVKEKENIEAVSVGAILSDYQRVRVENVCERLGLTSLSYLWRRDQKELLREMIDSGIHAVVIKVATLGLEPDKHLQKTLGELYPHLLKMNEMYELNVCGEGGEYETFTLDCPLFNKKIVLDEVEMVIHSADAFAPVGYLNIKKAHLEKKDMNVSLSWRERLQDLPLKRSCDLQLELFREGDLLCPDCQEPENVKCPPTNTDVDKFSLKTSENILWISGLRAFTQHGLSIAESTQKMMERLKDGIEDSGYSLNQLVLVCLYVQNMDVFTAVNSTYKKYFSVNPPARVCVEASLPQNICLQMDCCGYIGEEGRHTMHVQGISHWAPANIGPYSQSVKLNSTVYVAGQIALCPASMTIIEGGIVAESCLSLRHVDRVCAAMSPGCGLTRVISVVCYVTNKAYILPAADQWKTQRNKYSTQSGDVKQTTPCVQTYVVIPRLPRGAMVEWQVYASMAEQVQDDEEKLSDGGYQVTVRYCYSRSTDKLFSCSAEVVLTDTLDKGRQPLHDKAVQLFLVCYEKVLHKIGRTWSDVPLIRIFFCLRWGEYSGLLQAFNTCLEEKVGTPVLSLVPACELATPQTIMSVCH